MPSNEPLDIDLSKIQDPGARAAVSEIMDFVNTLVSAGLKTNGVVQSTKLVVGPDEQFRVQEDGSLKALSFLNHGEVLGWGVTFREGELTGGGGVTIRVPGRAFGCFGISDFDGNPGLSWPIVFNDTINNPVNDLGVNLFLVSNDGVTLNNPSANTNRYRILIFYAVGKI